MKIKAALSLRETGLVKRALLYLLLLGLLFFISYGFATWLTSQRHNVPSLVFAWESQIPFWAWTIIPYWSIDLLYAISLFICATHFSLKRHVLRLFSGQIIAVTCFLLWPLQFTFSRPKLDGVFGGLFDLLAMFDKPFNQAPSLHIILTVILWSCYSQYTHGWWRWLCHAWFALIALSVLTTYQHHFFDVPSGIFVGALCLWLWPNEGLSPLQHAKFSTEPKRLRMALYYLGGAILLGLIAIFGGRAYWILLWPCASLLLVALNYSVFGAMGFQKNAVGRLSVGVSVMLWPYLIMAKLNSRLWTYQHPQADLIADNVWLGRIPNTNECQPFAAIVDLCAELPINSHGLKYTHLPVLDLTAPTAQQCLSAAISIESLRQHGPLLVCCALGYSRSATALAAWLINSGRVNNPDDAIALIRSKRPHCVLSKAHMQALTNMIQLTVHQ